MITAIPEGFAEVMWESFKPYLARAVQDYPFDPVTDAELQREVRSGKLLLLQIADGQGTRAICGLRFVRDREGAKVLHVAYLSGDSHEMWVDELHQYIWDLARAEHCRWIDLTGRPGWRKVLRRFNDNPTVVSVHLRAEVH